MKKETICFVVLPGLLMILAVWIGELSATVGWTLLAPSFVTSVACLARAVTLFRSRRPVAYLCGTVGMFYLAILYIMVLTPAKTRSGAQPQHAADASLPFRSVQVRGSLAAGSHR